jgi:hypothetical protein
MNHDSPLSAIKQPLLQRYLLEGSVQRGGNRSIAPVLHSFASFPARREASIRPQSLHEIKLDGLASIQPTQHRTNGAMTTTG